MRLSFLFWNVARKPLQERLTQIALWLPIDVVLLAECVTPSEDWLNALNRGRTISFAEPDTLARHRRLRFFSKTTVTGIADQYNDTNGRITIRRLSLPGYEPFLLAVVHFPSKVNNDPDDQIMRATELSRKIRQAEKDASLDRTIVVGDLNMNPYEPGMIGAIGLHAMMTQKEADRETRIVDGEPYPFFYNPMWAHFGDRTPGPEGTYYLTSSKVVNPFWNIYDQVLLRPSMMGTLRELRILDSDGVQSLMKPSGAPDEEGASDHLPIYFSLEMQEQ